MAHGDAGRGSEGETGRMEWVASTLHTTSELGVTSITTADATASAASSRPNWRHQRFKWTRPFRRKTKSGFCACAITFQTQSTGSFSRVKRPGRGADRPPPSSAVVKERIELYVYSPFGPSCPVIGSISPSPLVCGARGGLVVKALRHKPAGRGFDSRWCHWNFSAT